MFSRLVVSRTTRRSDQAEHGSESLVPKKRMFMQERVMSRISGLDHKVPQNADAYQSESQGIMPMAYASPRLCL